MECNRFVFGVLAEVDAGKTTLSEQLLYQTGTIRQAGRVDKGNSHLDTDTIETERGITVFSSQAYFSIGEKGFTLLDTPGHADLSGETQRVLSVLDFSVFVISATNGLRGHGKTLWNLLRQFQVPTIIFINKTDLTDETPEKLLALLKETTGNQAVFANHLYGEETAVLDDELMERYLSDTEISDRDLVSLFQNSRLFPVLTGSALKGEGIPELLHLMDLIMPKQDVSDRFGGMVFKLSHDQNDRLVHCKISSGTISVKEILPEGKIEQIRLYQGTKWTGLSKAEPGMVVQLLGLNCPIGTGLGCEQDLPSLPLKPVFSVSMAASDESDAHQLLLAARSLEEEMPELSVQSLPGEKEVQISFMGGLQTEVIQKLMESRFHIPVHFGRKKILYQETITAPVEGVGHYEPLRHYSEVHLRLEPLPSGSGLQYASELSEDVLPAAYQHVILSYLKDQRIRGTLTGSPITDMKITLIAGKHHVKHTEGGDFQEAAKRAVRHGLMKTESCLLEPWMQFEMTIPASCLGRAMTDIDARLHGSCATPMQEGESCRITGFAPAAKLSDYPLVLTEYTRGCGSITVSFDGYRPCHNASEVIEETGYNPNADLEQPAGSIFCSHGTGVFVDWKDVEDWMHLPLKSPNK